MKISITDISEVKKKNLPIDIETEFGLIEITKNSIKFPQELLDHIDKMYENKEDLYYNHGIRLLVTKKRIKLGKYEFCMRSAAEPVFFYMDWLKRDLNFIKKSLYKNKITKEKCICGKFIRHKELISR